MIKNNSLTSNIDWHRVNIHVIKKNWGITWNNKTKAKLKSTKTVAPCLVSGGHCVIQNLQKA